MANHDDGIRSMDDIRFGDNSVAIQGNVGVLHHDNIRFHAGPSANQANYHANNQTNTHNYYGTPTPGTPNAQACVRVGLPPRNANRVERERLFEELEQILPREGKHEPVALWGMAGIGKTQLALHYAHQRFHLQKCSVFWINAQDKATFIDSFKIIAQHARIDVSSDDRVMLLNVREWIESQPTWVMVIDGADDVKLFTRNGSGRFQLCEFIPDGPNGTIIWTSHDKRILEVVGWTRGLKVFPMETDEAVTLLELTANHGRAFENAEATLQLVCQLDCNPLVVFHVAMSMQENSSPEEMVSRLEDPHRRREILEARCFDMGASQGVSRTILGMLTSPVERLASHDPEAYRIIAMIAYMNDYSIPLEVFLDVDGHRGDGPVRRAIARLKDLSLIRDNPTNLQNPIDAVGLMQEAIRHHLANRRIQDDVSKVDEGRREQGNLSTHVCFRSQAITALLRIWPRTISHDTLNLGLPLLRHALSACQWEPYEQKSLAETADLLIRAGDYMLFYGWWRDMETTYERALQLRKDSFGTTDVRTIEAMDSLAHAHMKLGNYQSALERTEEARQTRTKSLGLPETHPDVITSGMNIGIAQRKLGRLSTAEALLTKTLALQVEILGEDHPDHAQGMYEMAQLYRAQRARDQLYRPQGLRDKQTELLTKSLSIQSRHLGDENPRTMETKLRLGTHLDLVGDGVEAKTLHQEVLDVQYRLFGDRHPRTLDAKLRYGTATYWSEDSVDMALRVSSEVAADAETTLGRAHPLTLRARGIHASLLSHERQNRAEAAAMQKDVLNIYLLQLGRTHHLSLTMQVSLANTLFSQGEMRDSKELATPAHDALCAQFGTDDARTIAAAELLGHLEDVPEYA